MKTHMYLVYRHGSNSANQHLRNKMPVAIIDASSRAQACETERPENPTIADSSWLRLDKSVDCWANQSFSAVPVSKAPVADVREVEESW